MDNDKNPQATPSDIKLANLSARISRLEADNRALEVAVEAHEEDEPDWSDFADEEPEDREDVKVLARIEKALPDDTALLWANDEDGNLLTMTVPVPEDDDEDEDDDE
jgi:hypothetical protein